MRQHKAQSVIFLTQIWVSACGLSLPPAASPISPYAADSRCALLLRVGLQEPPLQGAQPQAQHVLQAVAGWRRELAWDDVAHLPSKLRTQIIFFF